MTKFLTKAALAATVATGLLATPAMAADTETFTARARIVSPLTLTKNTDLNFGTITMLPGLTSSTVVVARAGAGGGTTACGANLQCTAPTAASFSVTGSIGQGLTVTTSPLSVLTSGAGDTVGFAINAPTAVTLAPAGVGAGTVSFEIGGTLTVLAATVDGTYTGDVDVTVEYS